MTEMARHANRFLAELAPGDLHAIQPYLRKTVLEQGVTLIEPDRPADRVFFPHSGLISVVIDLECGGTVETGMVGRDSGAGIAEALDDRPAFCRAIVQAAGEAFSIEAGRLRAAARSNEALRLSLYRHSQLLTAQAQQSVGCASKHHINERLCRWLLRVRDLLGSDTIPLTQEFLGQMMGVRRTSVTLVANELQAAGLIKYSRGRIVITNIEELRAAACECYAALTQYEANLLGTPREVALAREPVLPPQ